MRSAKMFMVLVLGLLVSLAVLGKAAPMATAWTYQGRLMDANIPADGLHDFQFKLFDDPYKGTQLGITIDVNHIDVIDGYFTVEVDFGNKVFNGEAMWLEISVRPGFSIGRFTILNPRQEVSPSPYAIHANDATDADKVDGYDAGNASGNIAVSNGNICTNLNADKLDGFHSTAFAVNDHNHDSLYINETGDTMRADDNGWLLLVDNTGIGGAIDGSSVGMQSIGVRGTSHGNNGVGVRGNALGDDGYGVFGYASSTSGRGVYGLAMGDLGYGVYGYASADGAIASNYGGYFQADGAYGHGVYAKVEGANSWAVQGYATATGDTVNYGGYFESYGDRGYGIYGKSAGREGYGVFGVATYEGLNTNYGGYFIAYGRYGRGVYGESTGGEGYGVYGVASGGEAAGVYGYASKKGDWNNPGGRFVSWGNYASGVVGSGFGSNSRGVSGIAGNYPDSTNYGGHFEATGTTGIAVYGWARNNADAQNYGGQFIAEGTRGIGVYGQADSANGWGVVGVGGEYDFYANGPGVNYGASSSVRWKRNIQAIDKPLDKVLKLQGVYFDWDAEHGGEHDVGMIAEEVGQVLPEIVGYEDNGVDATGMDYSKLTPLLVEAVKELKGENDRLKSRVEALEKTIQQIVNAKEVQL
ncbi:MAG: hypothetical protein GWN67_21135 [Phycisphaerae bacterium]|nr:tail fiber domain-containing protein [Phycisphaerae bacterium]NIQ75405.1 tail fiber domain-containing protein [Gammaproteobacteria bacterium]NIS53443.1 tail fiber domain-containing protein [Phycisphaerae bacterium]NIU58791.1 hypothetical protein [Phycisphaerae bacterium]NIW95064.1 hypothetical protein [Phycisphaerae bacterium]